MKIRTGLLILSFAVIGCSQNPDYLETVREFENRKSAGDVEAVLALFVDEPSLHFGTLGTISGRPALRGILEYDVALNTKLDFAECTVNGEEVTCRVVESNDWLKLVDIESITYDENRFVFAPDGRIDSVVAILSSESGQSLGAVMAEFHGWATMNHPEEYGSLFSEDGAFVYSRENAGKVLELLRIWRSD